MAFIRVGHNFLVAMIPEVAGLSVSLIEKAHKKARESATLLIPRIWLSHCHYYRISNAEAHAYDTLKYIKPWTKYIALLR